MRIVQGIAVLALFIGCTGIEDMDRNFQPAAFVLIAFALIILLITTRKERRN